jgi:hypothetical protein
MARRPSELASLRAPALAAAKRRFQEIFPGRFADESYLAWERDYKREAHLAWEHVLNRADWTRLHERAAYEEVAERIARFYGRSRLNMLALYEWMALREALADHKGAQLIARGLYDLIHGEQPFGRRLERFTEVLDAVPQRQTRLAKWPVATLFPFVADPQHHLILKPRIIKKAAQRYGVELLYRPRPNALTYAALMEFVEWLGGALSSWRPRDLMDIQGFLWVTNSEEYEDWPWE